ncbi:hypothetical protein QQZ08_009383 [Neonectria magnoliae]|uniref:Methyltransferase domain-containing protein n=1 Tax=Neonectria magnoliae TaxID=2732573 RepID=A0ABR1HND9_9HYPO
MAELDDPAVTTYLEPEDQQVDDSGVDEAADDVSSTQSISSSILRYRVENGRTYTTYGSGEYSLPTDEEEQDRLTDEHEEAEVLGLDLSPIQPSWFEVDDLEKPWMFKHPFDFVFIRSMIASFKDWRVVFNEAFKNIEPGGYIEVQDNVYPLASDNDTTKSTNILRWSELMVEAADKLGRSITVARDFESMLADAGFVDIVEIRKKIPMNRWPKDLRYKELGTWSCHMLRNGIEGISMGLLTGLGLSVEEVHVLLANVRKDLSDTTIHGYWDTYDTPLP